MGRRKHIPVRTCIACRSKRPKRELLRIVRTPNENVVLDTVGKVAGRGAYVCRQQECLETAVQNSTLSRALKTTISPEIVAELRAQLAAIGHTEE